MLYHRAVNGDQAKRFRAKLIEFYGANKADAIRYAEAFEICEYGAQPNETRIRELFPMLR